MAKNWMKQLQNMEGVVLQRKDRFAKVLRSYSPSANFVYGRTHGLPYGYSEVLYGPPKGGKSVYTHMKIGWLHQTDPEAIAIKIDTEYRSDGQLDEDAMRLFGIDPGRLIIIQSNNPKHVFDQIEKKIAAMCQEGAPIRLIIIDSITSVLGRREMETDSVTDQLIGDHAQTVQIGMKKIVPVIRDHDIALLIVVQVRAEMDQTEQKRGNKFKMQAGFGLQHTCEYFTCIEEVKTAAQRKTLEGKELVNEGLKDVWGDAEKTGMKIKVKMRESSMGPKGRAAVFTFDFKRGVISQYEEVFHLAKNRKIAVLSGSWVNFGEKKWQGWDAFARALKEDPALCQELIDELMRRDLAGVYAAEDAEAAEDEAA